MSVALAVAAGVTIDRWYGLPGAPWLLLAGGFILAGLAMVGIASAAHSAGTTPQAGRGRFAASAAVLLLWLCIGGLRHHTAWSLRSPDNISAFVPDRAAPVRIVGRLQSAPLVVPPDRSSGAPQWTQLDRTIADVECQQVGMPGEERPTSGLVRMVVTGHLPGAQIGDAVDVLGTLQRPAGRLNPGGFDYGAYLRARGVDATLQVAHPDHARWTSAEPHGLDRLRRWRGDLRREAERRFSGLLRPAHLPLATSLLLGDRSGIDADLAEDFAESGTMHLLAISGLNVGIVAGLLHLVCRLAQAGPRTTLLALMVGVIGYAFVTDQQPPVLRAAVLAVAVLSARALDRDAGGYQSLALCAVAILLWRPTDLFDPGAQLSFVAVMAIIWSGRWLDRGPTALGASSSGGRGETIWSSLGEGLRRAWVMTGCIWLATLPLTAWHFHLCSPVGLVVNVLLMPFTTLMMAAGYLMLLVGLAHPLPAVLPAMAFEGLLAALLWVVRMSASTPLGHFYLPGPPGWWLAGFYLLLLPAAGVLPWPIPTRRAWQVLAGWTALGLACGLSPARTDSARFTFLSVGHGCAVLVEAPGDFTLLYDAGSIAGGRRAAQTVRSALWSRDRVRLDAVVVSHADMDHYNAVAGLAESLPVGSILLPHSAIDFRQSALAQMCEAAAQAGTPLRLIQAGDRIQLGPHMACSVLHPAGGRGAAEDNANSAVLLLEFAGRRVLLTGDLEGEGLSRLLSLPPRSVDVLLAPHHGSVRANPVALAEWAAPGVVVASTADTDVADRLSCIYADRTDVHATSTSGAVTVTIDARGDLCVETLLTPRSPAACTH